MKKSYESSEGGIILYTDTHKDWEFLCTILGFNDISYHMMTAQDNRYRVSIEEEDMPEALQHADINDVNVMLK